MHRSSAVLLAVLALGIATGCGAQAEDSSDEFSGAEQEVAQAVERLQATAQDRDAEGICGDVLTKELAASLKRERLQCASLLEDALDDADSFELDVEDVTVTGDRATAEVVSGSGEAAKRATLALVREGTAWRISDLGR